MTKPEMMARVVVAINQDLGEPVTPLEVASRVGRQTLFHDVSRAMGELAAGGAIETVRATDGITIAGWRLSPRGRRLVGAAQRDAA